MRPAADLPVLKRLLIRAKTVMPLLTACTVTLVQSHYITVLYRITGRTVWLAAITAILTAAQLAFALFVTVCAFNEDLWQANITKVRPALATWLFLCAGADVLITSGISECPFRRFPRSGELPRRALTLNLHAAYSLRRIQVDFARTNDLIGRLVQLTLANNGLVRLSMLLRDTSDSKTRLTPRTP